MQPSSERGRPSAGLASPPESFAEMLQHATALNSTPLAPSCAAEPQSSDSWNTVAPGFASPPVGRVPIITPSVNSSCASSVATQPTPSTADPPPALPEATEASRGGWLVDLVDWVQSKAEPETEELGYVYDHEIRAWIPRGMSADEWLAQEAMRKQEEALRPPLGPPPTGPPPTGPPPPGGFRRS